jgi:hypothetical protein
MHSTAAVAAATSGYPLPARLPCSVLAGPCPAGLSGRGTTGEDFHDQHLHQASCKRDSEADRGGCPGPTPVP